MQIYSQFSPDLVKYTEEILGGKLHFCAVSVAPKAVKAAQQASCVIEIDDSD